MVLWSIAVFCFLLGARTLFEQFGGVSSLLANRREAKALQRVIACFHELEETLEAGLVPSSEAWERFDRLPDPWGRLSGGSLRELRARGAALLPTAKRIRALAEEHDAALKDARAKSAQALSQALVCSLLVPIFGSTLYVLLPGVESAPASWLAGCALAFLWTSAGALWLLHMSESARWAGLVGDERAWVLGAQCAGERFLALVRSGLPSDLAWVQAAELLESHAPGLAAEWGHSVWAANDFPELRRRRTGAAAILFEAGSSLKKCIQTSLMEGRPCTERVEAALLALGRDIRAQIERELALLGTRALKPLFICVAPSLLGLLVLGLVLGWKEALSGLD